jgi:hypothetical protein
MDGAKKAARKNKNPINKAQLRRLPPVERGHIPIMLNAIANTIPKERSAPSLGSLDRASPKTLDVNFFMLQLPYLTLYRRLATDSIFQNLSE